MLPKPAATTCAHCGDPVPAAGWGSGETLFCCQGCELVHGLLHDNGLDGYYRLADRPGTRRRHRARYEWLDERSVADTLLAYRDDAHERVVWQLPAIHCAACVWLLENLHRLHAGVGRVAVDFRRREARIDYDPAQLTMRELAELLDRIGYPPHLSLQDIERDERPAAVDRGFYYRLGVAGFAFGNIMLFSFPEYLGLRAGSLQTALSYFNLLLAIPVLFYSGGSYLRNAWTGLRQGRFNLDLPIALGLLTLFGRSIFEITAGSGVGYLDSLAGLVFFLLVGRWVQRQTYHRIAFDRDYTAYFPVAATVLTPEGTESKALSSLRPGDRIRVRAGELIPADATLLRGTARIDYSFVTGEAQPLSRRKGDHVYAGGRQTGEAVDLLLTKRVEQSYLTKLWNDQAFDEKKARSGGLADRTGRWFTLAILSVAALTLVYWLAVDPSVAVNAFTAVLIIACPCAIALSIPFTFGNAARLLARWGFYVRDLRVLEDLTEIDTTILDKTGTLTDQERPALTYAGEPLDDPVCARLRALAAQSTHPLSKLLTAWCGRRAGAHSAVPLHAFVDLPGRGIAAHFGRDYYQIGSAAWLGVPDWEDANFGFAVNGTVKGRFRATFDYRHGLDRVLGVLAQTGPIHLLSGDYDHERTRLAALLPPDSELHFRQSPHDKLAFVKARRAAGARCLMLGDGLNDAGALRAAHVGVVVTQDEHQFIPGCDALLAAPRFGGLPGVLAYARACRRLVYVTYALALVYNAVGLYFAVQGLLSPVIAAILMPLSSITIVLVGSIGSQLLFRPDKDQVLA